MTELSGDPSALTPNYLDVASPITPIIDLARYQTRTYVLYEDALGGVASGTAILLQDTSEFQQARAWELQSVSWEDNYGGSAWDGWVELFANFNLGNGTSFQKCLMANYTTILGPARDVQVIVDLDKMDRASYDKPFAHDGSLVPSENVGQVTLDSLIWKWEKLGGAGTPDFTDIVCTFKLSY